MHCEPLALHRVQIGCSLLHFTLEAAQASQEARSLGLRSLADLGDVLVWRGVEVGMGWLGVSGGCHSGVCCLNSIVAIVDDQWNRWLTIT